MADAKKTIVKEISLWKKRYQDSKKALEEVYKDVSLDAKKAYKKAIK
jgi:hypothetical protein